MKKKYWAINIPSWGIHLIRGSEKQANEWMDSKAEWEGGSGSKVEIPFWLFKNLKWHHENEVAVSVAAHRMFGKEKMEEFMVLKEELRREYEKDR